jgi:hypothetical protein
VREKRASYGYRKYSHETLLSVMRRYHADFQSQTSIAREMSIPLPTVHLIVHGACDYYRAAYEQVAAELREDAP